MFWLLLRLDLWGDGEDQCLIQHQYIVMHPAIAPGRPSARPTIRPIFSNLLRPFSLSSLPEFELDPSC